MIDLKNSLRGAGLFAVVAGLAGVLVLTPAAARADEANFGILGALFAPKSEEAKAPEAKPEEAQGEAAQADAAQTDAPLAGKQKSRKSKAAIARAEKAKADEAKASEVKANEAKTSAAKAAAPVEQPVADNPVSQYAPVAQDDEGEDASQGKAGLKGSAPAAIRALIAQHAAANGVPLRLADAIVRIESRYNPRASNHGALGLMQIKAQTARGVGFSGPPSALFNADTNLRYGMKYLAQVYAMSGGNVCATVMRYQTGVAATHLSAANRAYCAKAKLIMGAAGAAGGTKS